MKTRARHVLDNLYRCHTSAVVFVRRPARDDENLLLALEVVIVATFASTLEIAACALDAWNFPSKISLNALDRS
jgi:hypothetical protein